MMKLKNTYLLVFLLAATFAFSQSVKKIAKQAKKDFKAKNYQAAAAGYTKALALKPNVFAFLVNRGTSYEKINQPQEAIADFKQAITLKPTTKNLYMKVGDLSMGLGDYATAVTYLDNLIGLDKKNIEALQKVSFSFLKLKRFDLALDRANKALEIQRYNYTNHYYKALALDSLKDYVKANLDYESAIRLVLNEVPNGAKPLPKFKPYYANAALVLYRLGANDDAIKYYNEATAIDPSDNEEPHQYYVYYLENQPYLKKTDFTNSIGYLNKCMALNPKFIDGFFARAEVYKQTSQFQSAISDYTKVLQTDNNNVNALFSRGKCYLELGNYSEAIGDLRQATKLQPQNADIKNLLKEATDKNYQANKENDAPILMVANPTIDNNGFANILDNQLDILVDGTITDKSLINEIKINGQKIPFAEGEKNPTFTYKLSANGITKIEINVTDIYFNSTNKTIKIGRIIDNSRTKVEFAGNIISDDANRKPYANRVVYITNEKGEILYQTKTDAMGHFKFDKLPYDKKYLLTLDAQDASFAGIEKFMVVDKNGNTILVSKILEKGKYKFEIIPSDANVMSLMTVEDQPIRIDVKGKLIADNPEKTPIASVKFLLMNERDEIILFHVTDAEGNFNFPGLLPSGKYNFAIDVLDSKKIAFNKIFVTDENGKIIKEIVKDAEGVFKFKLLESERASLSTLAAEDFDPWANLKFTPTKKEIEIIENIYYESGSFKIPASAEPILTKAINAMKTNPTLLLEVQSHTDATAGDEYNMDLSQKRANAVVEYLISKGIEKKRLTAKGFGETQLTNKCANGVDCSDEEHRQNRRTVFKLSYP
jgi:tetratricopeptide (TPR) repeat protein/outer membrane protein OmpA-like peptidoglycan-associated protein